MKDELCKAFCDQIEIRTVDAGLAVGTSFPGINGDPIGFYVIGPNANGQFRIEDNGATVPILEASGADLDLESRAKAFYQILREHGAEYDAERGELKTASLSSKEVPAAAVRFMTLLLRIQDLLLLAQEKVASTFREEATRRITEAIGQRAKVTTRERISDQITDFPADIMIRAQGRPPVAVYLVLQDAQMLTAMLAQTEAEHKFQIPCKVIALMEEYSSVTQTTLRAAINRITPLNYRGEEDSAIKRIYREALDEVHKASVH
jgi:hypothetical protein